MKGNLGDKMHQGQTTPEPPGQTEEDNGNPGAGLAAGLIAMLMLAAGGPVFVHSLIEIAEWSWNLV